MRGRAVVLGFVVAVGGGVGAASAHDPYAPSPASTCVQAVNTGPTGGPGLGDGVVLAKAGGGPCRFTAMAEGGFLAVGDRWYVTITRPDGTARYFSSSLRSAPCWEDVIAPGDTVEAGASGAVTAGEGVIC